MRIVAIIATLAVACFASPQKAYAWEWFRSENQHVADGNARMHANDGAGALRLYDQAARELPSEAGVHLNRGLALLATNDIDHARAAFLLATDPPATAEIRSAAYYNLGLGFYRQADAKAGENDHQEAQRLFREAADSFRRSLRVKPGNRDAAWNLELALRRIQEQQQQQQQQDQQQQQQQNQDQQQQQNPDQQQQNQDSQNPDQQQQQNQDGQNQQNPDQQNPNGQDQQHQDQDPQQQQPGQQDQNRDQQGQPRETNGDQQNGQNPGGEDPSTAQEGEDVPGDVARVLDSLQDGEENLERMRARVRAMRENRRPAQDW